MFHSCYCSCILHGSRACCSFHLTVNMTYFQFTGNCSIFISRNCCLWVMLHFFKRFITWMCFLVQKIVVLTLFSNIPNTQTLFWRTLIRFLLCRLSYEHELYQFGSSDMMDRCLMWPLQQVLTDVSLLLMVEFDPLVRPWRPGTRWLFQSLPQQCLRPPVGLGLLSWFSRKLCIREMKD